MYHKYATATKQTTTLNTLEAPVCNWRWIEPWHCLLMLIKTRAAASYWAWNPWARYHSSPLTHSDKAKKYLYIYICTYLILPPDAPPCIFHQCVAAFLGSHCPWKSTLSCLSEVRPLSKERYQVTGLLSKLWLRGWSCCGPDTGEELRPPYKSQWLGAVAAPHKANRPLLSLTVS